uniref:NADH-ubiquinone oxidoreductase chain 2 n=1 Tax=Laelaps chini TaxID=2902761 RepID=A0AAU6QE04_9ACAR
MFSWMKMLSYMMMFMSFMVVLSSDSYFFMWVSFELNLVSFCYIMWEGKLFSSINSMMKYYIIQSFSSMIFLISLIISESIQFFNLSMNFLSLMMIFKMGMFPFMFWLSEVVEGMSWESLIMFFTGQKVIPFYVMTLMDFYYMSIIIIMSIFTGIIMMFNQMSLRKFLVYSSLVHSSWMMSSIEVGLMVWIIYLFIYFMMMSSFYLWKNLDSFFQLKYLKMDDLMMILIIFFNLSGLPPFLGFLSKMFIMFYMWNYNFSILVYLIMGSIIGSYIYLNYMVMMFFLKNYKISKNNKKMKYKLFFMMLSYTLFISLLFFF